MHRCEPTWWGDVGRAGVVVNEDLGAQRGLSYCKREEGRFAAARTGVAIPARDVCRKPSFSQVRGASV